MEKNHKPAGEVEQNNIPAVEVEQHYKPYMMKP